MSTEKIGSRLVPMLFGTIASSCPKMRVSETLLVQLELLCVALPTCHHLSRHAGAMGMLPPRHACEPLLS